MEPKNYPIEKEKSSSKPAFSGSMLIFLLAAFRTNSIFPIDLVKKKALWRGPGMSAANTVVENGGRVVLLDKSSFCGGNSTKATSGINGAGGGPAKKTGGPPVFFFFLGGKTQGAKKLGY